MDEENIENIDDIFDEYEQIIEGRDEANGNATGEQSADAENREVIPAPTKRIVRNPRIKFDANRLIGGKGLPVLLDHFKDIKFKGKGHELEDLNHLLATLEHWTHRLFPSMQFEDCLLQIEKLGKKKPVQTCVQKIRLDMPLLARDFVEEADETDDVLRNEDNPPYESAFDQLLDNHRESPGFDADERERTSSVDVTDNNELNSTNAATSTNVLSDEQKARMERNRLLAAERLKARLSHANNSSNTSVDTCQEAVEPPIGPEMDDQTSFGENPDPPMDEDDDDNHEEISKKGKKRLRIESSSSEEDIAIDDLVEESLYD